MRSKKYSGFTLIELLVVIGIMGVLAGIVLVAARGATVKTRDARRKSDLGQIGRYMTSAECFIPDAGAGDYDLSTLVPELKNKYPQFSQFIQAPQDPKSGTSAQSNYHYLVSDSAHCILYANLENENEPLTLTSVTAPSSGVDSGVLQSSSAGPNGTRIFYQIGK